jgi:hypothetical protein
MVVVLQVVVGLVIVLATWTATNFLATVALYPRLLRNPRTAAGISSMRDGVRNLGLGLGIILAALVARWIH